MHMRLSRYSTITAKSIIRSASKIPKYEAPNRKIVRGASSERCRRKKTDTIFCALYHSKINPSKVIFFPESLFSRVSDSLFTRTVLPTRRRNQLIATPRQNKTFFSMKSPSIRSWPKIPKMKYKPKKNLFNLQLLSESPNRENGPKIYFGRRLITKL